MYIYMGGNTGKAQKKPTSDKKKKNNRSETYSLYIDNIVEQVNPDTGISCKAL